MEKKKGNRYLQLERFAKGFANHRRIQIMDMLAADPELSLGEIADAFKSDYQTIAVHVQKLALSGLVMKRHDGTHVRHALTTLGERTLKFLRSL